MHILKQCSVKKSSDSQTNASGHEVFVTAAKYMPWSTHGSFGCSLGQPLEAKEYARARKNLKSVGVKTPLTLGLDTSLAQVGLSLAKRNLDPYATKSEYFEKNPRRNDLKKYPQTLSLQFGGI